MTTKPYGKSANNLVHINRMTIAELEIAIADLEARGYELVKRDDIETVSDVKDYHYRDNIGAKWKFSGSSESLKRCSATMKRAVPYVK
ncbi:hypothetical protein OR571_16150 [Psychrobacillus sp. NEAU-3TGS]|uniref:hypothetical protein n=1 Tax=Psychrobacillus sp. NEAU-3TGS TaxID=2995412 RepID=UPI0024992A06|nr:hypothetical protein [Psychrobacillus sp. NEAU-3TGS]MDI2588597.1 hypothetical protein [Psychrobacillus sp. NEAU-3TGS]